MLIGYWGKVCSLLYKWATLNWNEFICNSCTLATMSECTIRAWVKIYGLIRIIIMRVNDLYITYVYEWMCRCVKTNQWVYVCVWQWINLWKEYPMQSSHATISTWFNSCNDGPLLSLMPCTAIHESTQMLKSGYNDQCVFFFFSSGY